MVVIISDLHLTDGSSGETIRSGAFRMFADRLRDLAYNASWRPDGTYLPLEELHLILLGDILDIIRSTQWLEEENGASVRPWSDSASLPFINKVSAITAKVIENNAPSLAILKSFSQDATITVPEATAERKPAKVGWEPDAPHRQPVRVRIHYLVGNHDWFFHLPYEPYNAIRQAVVDAIGVETPANKPFPHDPYESDVLRQIYEDHRIFARHGDIYDPYNFPGDRNSSSLGDAVVVELVDRFAMAVRGQMGQQLPELLLTGLKEIDNLRPTAMIPVWIDGLLRKTCPNDPSTQKKVKDVWDCMVDDFIKLDFVQQHHSFFHLFDSVSDLEWGLKFSKGVSHGNLSRLFAWIDDKFAAQQNSYYPHALSEVNFKNRMARFIVYGHTHWYEQVPLSSILTDDGVLNQIYINSGTWRPYHELARPHPEQEEFVGYQVMTYLSFFKDDERNGRLFESWSGALGDRGNVPKD
jgi:UDP-2,3-diacylglucosamine pyrophosphatase LpxH